MIMAYLAGNNNFAQNGTVLLPSKCDLKMSLKDYTWSLELDHPLDKTEKWKSLEKEGTVSIILYGKQALFTIKNYKKKDSGVTIKAEPIFMNARTEHLLTDVRPTNKTAQEALNIMMNGSPYSGRSDLPGASTAYYVRKNLIEALFGKDENSFVNRWGGEVWFDNYTVEINRRIGSDNELKVLYGKNVEQNGFEFTEDTNDVVTRIYPVAYNGRMMTSSIQYVDSVNINKYPKVKARYVDFNHIKLASDLDDTSILDTDIICNTEEELNQALIDACRKKFSEGIDLPTVNIKINMVLLENSVQYSSVKDIVSAHLGDTVYCKNEKLDIEVPARIISLTYDAIKERVIKAEIGDPTFNFFFNSQNVSTIVDKITNSSGNVEGDAIQGVINLLYASLHAQKNAAQKQDVRAILFEDIDPNSPTFGAMSIGTKGIQIAGERNETNTDWLWGTAIDFKTMYANYIITGILADKLGNFYFNLDTGDLKIKNGSFGGLLDGATYKSSKTKKVTYTTEDVTVVSNYLKNDTGLTDEQLEKYDINCDGRVTTSDSLLLSRLLGNSSSVTVDVVDYVEINSDETNTVKIGKKVGTLGASETKIEGIKIDSRNFYGQYFVANQSNGNETAELNPISLNFETSNTDNGGKDNLKIVLSTGGGSWNIQYNSYDSHGAVEDNMWLNYNKANKSLSTNVNISTNGTMTAKSYETW